MGIPQSVEAVHARAWSDRLKSFFVGRSLDACIEGGRDNVLQLRLLAAVMVIFGHSYAVFGAPIGYDEPLHLIFPGIVTHVTGVNLFFTISGVLITLSWLRRPELGRFVRARFLRIWPALAVCVTLLAFVLGPLVTSLTLKKYFEGDAFGTPLGFVFHWCILVARPFLPGVFEHTPMSRSVNGSLWTLPLEATMYLCVAALGVLRCFRFPWLTSLGIVGVFAGLVLYPMYSGQWPSIYYVQAAFFGAGCVFCLLRRHVPVSSGLMLLILMAAIVSRARTHVIPLTWLAIGYFVLWFCYVPRIPVIPRGIDVSYGTYLWAFPIQQLLILRGVGDPLLMFALATPLALAAGALSWFCVEKPALRLKDVRWRVPRSQPIAQPARSVETA